MIEQAQQLNQTPLSIHGKPICPLGAPVIVESADVGLEVLKKAGKKIASFFVLLSEEAEKVRQPFA